MFELATVQGKDLNRSFRDTVCARGRSYYRKGRVARFVVTSSGFRAQVQGSGLVPCRVIARVERGRLASFECSCADFREWGELCTHQAAALLRWIQERDGAAPLGPVSRREVSRKAWAPSGPSSILPRAGRLAEWSLQGLLSSYFESARPLVTVDLAGDGPSLTLRLEDKPSGRVATLLVPPSRVPGTILDLRSMPAVRWTERARKLKVETALRLVGQLRVDCGESGTVTITPGYGALRLRSSSSGVQARGRNRCWYRSDEVESGMVEGGWFWDGRRFFPVAPVSQALAPYFPAQPNDSSGRSGERAEPRFERTGDDAAEFFAEEFRRLEEHPEVRVGARLARAKIAEAELGWLAVRSPDRAGVLRQAQEPHAAFCAEAADAVASPGAPAAQDWLYLDGSYQAGGLPMELAEVLRLAPRQRYLRRGDLWIRLPHDELLRAAAEGLLRQDGDSLRISRLGYLRARAALAERTRLEEDEAVRRFVEALERTEFASKEPLAAAWKEPLYPHQKTAYQWLCFLWRERLGGVFADETGLSKSHAVLGFLARLAEHPSAGPVLVVSAPEKLERWRGKIESWVPGLSCRVADRISKSEMARGHEPPRVWLIPYTAVPDRASALGSLDWECLILDDAEKILSVSQETRAALGRVRANIRLALTDGPLGNRLGAMWALVDFAVPGYLGSLKEFRRHYELPVLRYEDPYARKALERLLGPFLLSRRKEDVLSELPDVKVEIRSCPLLPQQAMMYRRLLAEEGKPLGKLLALSDDPVPWVRLQRVLGRLEQISDHPVLLPGKRSRRKLLSGKFEAFKELLAELATSPRKIYVVSRYPEMLKRIGAHAKAAEKPLAAMVRLVLAGSSGQLPVKPGDRVIEYDHALRTLNGPSAILENLRGTEARGIQLYRLVGQGTWEERWAARAVEKGGAPSGHPSGTASAPTREELYQLVTVAPEVSRSFSPLSASHPGLRFLGTLMHEFKNLAAL